MEISSTIYLLMMIFCVFNGNFKRHKMPRGDKTSIMQYEVPIFDIDTQRKIASVLRSLDEKIELNSTINNNLAA